MLISGLSHQVIKTVISIVCLLSALFVPQFSMAKEYSSFYVLQPSVTGLQHDFVIKPKRKAFHSAGSRSGLSAAEYQALAEIDCLQMKTDLRIYEFIYNHFDEMRESLKQSGFNDISLSKEDFKEEYLAFKDQAENPEIICM